MKRKIAYFLILICLSSCSPKIFKGMKPEGKAGITKEVLYPIFHSEDTRSLFNMQINFKENNFTGLLIVKPEKDAMRAVFTSVFGLTVFDFEFNETEFKINRCIDLLNKEMILNLFKKDFRALFLYNISSDNPFKAKVYASENQKAYSIKTLDGRAYFLTNTKDKQIQKLEMPAFIARMTINYQNYNENFPGQIKIVHPKIGLEMILDKIE
jgi:hypothetical protein